MKCGIAGFGKIGQIRAREIQKNPDTELVAIFDIEGVHSGLEPGVKFCPTYEKLLEQDIDAVFICTYNHVLASYTKDALLAGKHAFCEKPPARTTEELKEVLATEKETGKVLKYGLNHRFHYSVMEAKKIIDSGKMGKLLWLRGVYGKAGSIDYDKNWRNYREYSGGGILIDQGIHMLDLMMHFTDEKFEQLNSFVTTSYWDIDAEDNAFAIMQTPSKVTAMLHSSATQWRHKFLLEMCLEEGYVNLDGMLSTTRSYAPEKLVVGRREFEDITFAMGKPKEETIWFEYDNSWKLELEDFVTAIQNNEKVKQGTSTHVYNALELVERIYESSGFYHEES